MKSYWFLRICQDLKKMDSQIRIVRLKLGFWRVYWKGNYLGELFEEMSCQYHDTESYDPRLESQKYYEEYEDHIKLVRTLKNFTEGYYDSLAKFRRRIYQLRHNPEFWSRSKRLGDGAVIK